MPSRCVDCLIVHECPQGDKKESINTFELDCSTHIKGDPLQIAAREEESVNAKDMEKTNHEQFNKIVGNRLDHCRRLLVEKGAEYSRNGDRLWNFKVAARMRGETPEQALLGMLNKHIVSVMDMVDGTSRGEVPSARMIDEKISDWINYGLLLEGLFFERALRAAK